MRVRISETGRLGAFSALATILIAAIGCSDAGEDLRACPPKGIGVEEFEGVSPGKQIEEFRQYNCSAAQICPDRNPAWAADPWIIDPEAPPVQVPAQLSNCSNGNSKLIIEKIAIYGDDRCAFSEASIEKREIDPRESIAIKTDYRPKPGEDHGEFRIFSNAQNYPVLRLSFCVHSILKPDGGVGEALVDAGPGGSNDAGAADAAQASTQDSGSSSGTALICKDVKKINASCHQE